MPDRLAPDHYEPVRLPPEVAALSSVPDTLAPGSPAKVGVLDLDFAVVGGRTELVGHYQKSPLQIMRPLYIDPGLPGMAFVYLMTTGGGVAQADRYRMDVRCRENAQVHLTSQAATKVYRMEHDYATQRVHLAVGAGGYLEHLPDPLIPFLGARFHQRTEVTVAPGGTAVVSETLTAGRLARGERHDYRVLALDTEIRRPDGTLLAVDTMRLTPGERGGGVLGPGVFSGHDHVMSLFVVTDLRPAAEIADTLYSALADHDLPYGVSVLPHDCGAWVRLLGDSPPGIAGAHTAAWDAVRRLLIDRPAPDLRKP